MSKLKLENLITQLHDQFGDDEVSPLQAQLIKTMESHIHTRNEPDFEDPDLRETAELLLQNVELDHPKAAEVIRGILKVLGDIGV